MIQLHLHGRGWIERDEVPALDPALREFIERGIEEARKRWREKREKELHK